MNSIGSNVFSSYQNAVIWGAGSGANDELRNKSQRVLQHYPLRRLDVRAVRGPLTRQILLKYGQTCPEIYGDPAILMPLIYAPSNRIKKRKVLVIPQFLYEVEIRNKYPQYEMVSMNTNNYKNTIDEIVASERVVTSSLHAIILAESYGVPAVYFKSLPKEIKFRDYYSSTGRNDIVIATSIEEAISIEPMPIPDLSSLQEKLMEAFPYDLWE